MQYNNPSYDISFAYAYSWRQPERDLEIALLILRAETDGHDDTACPAEIDQHFEVERALASNPHTPAVVLDHLAAHGTHPLVLERIACNPTSSQATLKRLANNRCSDVRVAVAENSNADEETLRLLAKDPSIDVRFSMAENHNLPGDILDALCMDENPYVAHRAHVTRGRLNTKGTGIQNLNDWWQHQSRRAV